MKRVLTSDDMLKARHALGMTQEQLCDALRIKSRNRTQTIRRWESGEIRPPGPVTVAMEALLTGFRACYHKDMK